jgi:hypothetical protein
LGTEATIFMFLYEEIVLAPLFKGYDIDPRPPQPHFICPHEAVSVVGRKFRPLLMYQDGFNNFLGTEATIFMFLYEEIVLAPLFKGYDIDFDILRLEWQEDPRSLPDQGHHSPTLYVHMRLFLLLDGNFVHYWV